MKMTAVIFATMISAQAMANCGRAELHTLPEIPDGRVATLEEMQRARQSVADYVAGSEAYLDCVKPQPFAHNWWVERMERVARRFNREREEFLQQRTAIAAN